MAGLLALSSCDKSGTEIREEGGAITISLSSAELVTRATMAGEDTYNENTIKRIDWFLYKKDKTSGQAVKFGRVDNLNAKGEETIRVNVTEEEVNTLIFPKTLGKNVCDVYLIVNLPDGVTISGTSVAELEALAIEANFASGTQKSFVMTGKGVAEIKDRKKILAASGTIDVDRVASKISLTAKVANSIEAGGKTWVSNPKTMKIQFCKGQSTAVLSGNPTAVAASSFDYEKRTYTKNTEKTENGFTIWNGDPFYSYPKTWNSGDKDAEPYLLIELPWSSEGGATNTYKSCYYKVFLSSEELVRNTWYDITLTLSVLGSFTDTEPTVMITGLEYKVCDWSSFGFSAEIQAARYLVVDQNEYVMNNIPTLEIPFLSSHECELVDVKVTRPNFGGNTPTGTVTQEPIDGKSWFTIKDNKSIVISHKLNNDYIKTTDYDYAPYTMTFTIRHSEAGYRDKFYENIKVIQYPAMYVDAKPNSKPDSYGGVFVNGGKSEYGSVHGLNGGNTNPNMYVVTTTVLPSGSNNMLCDTRKSTSYSYASNKNQMPTASAPSIQDATTKRNISYYYPTGDDASAENLLAPKYRIASSYGVTNPISYSDAVKRCASYQEDGYPAGRWRVPTKAEVFFMVKLSSDGIIPVLLSNGSDYWCADGYVTPIKGNTPDFEATKSGSCYVRCVYDEWYWGSEPALTGNAKSTFTWGDMPR